VSKVCLVSDQPVLLSGFARVLENREFEVSAFSTESLRAGGGSAAPTADLALLDVTAGLAFDVLADLNNSLPGCPVVLWSDTIPLDLVFKTLEFGVRGLIPRTSEPEFLVSSLKKVANGEMQIGFAAARDNAPSKRPVSLTPREREIVMRLRQGLRNKQIAAEMNITEGTVKIYLFRLFHKLGVRNRFELASYGGLDNPQFSMAGLAHREAAATIRMVDAPI
jgi:two-component system nitrate/nitrite response regulator NarL